MPSRLAATRGTVTRPARGTPASRPEPPPAHYSSFVIRWHRRPEPERIEVEHVQSGARARVSSAAGAITWMRRRMDGPPDLDPEPGGAAA